MLIANKIELRPTPEQATYLNQSCGARRHCYNQLLAHFSQPGVKWSKAAAYQYYMAVLRVAFPWYSEVSSRVTRNAIDDLDVGNRRLARSISDAGFGELRRQIEYKAAWRGVTVVIADRFFPSSKMCHACGQVHDLPLAQRTMVCDCGSVMDRDLNAAKNLDRYGLDRLDALKPDVKRTQESGKTVSAALALTA